MFFGPKGQLQIHVDIHSHLIPGVDDGVKSLNQSIEIIRQFQELGYSKLVTTPHISESYHPNTPTVLWSKFLLVQEEIKKLGIEMEIELGAEYLVDSSFLELLKNDGEILSWSGFVLIETSFTNFPLIFDEVVFELESKGLTPVLAHPERYEYWFGNTNKVTEVRERGVKMQVTASSLVGYYGPIPKKMAKTLLKESLVDFIGSDIHRFAQMHDLEKALGSRVLRNLDRKQLMNESLLG